MEIRCNKCQQLKIRNRAEITKEGKRNRQQFRGTCGRLWHGKTCPDCKQQESFNKDEGKIIIFSNRRKHTCLNCGEELEYNWYWHFDCMPKIDCDIAQYGCN